MNLDGSVKLVSQLLDLPIIDKDERWCGIVDCWPDTNVTRAIIGASSELNEWVVVTFTRRPSIRPARNAAQRRSTSCWVAPPPRCRRQGC